MCAERAGTLEVDCGGRQSDTATVAGQLGTYGSRNKSEGIVKGRKALWEQNLVKMGLVEVVERCQRGQSR
jgi:hypothetical protein